MTQMRTLLDAIEQNGGGASRADRRRSQHPLVQPGGHDDPAEPLFSAAKSSVVMISSAANLARPDHP